MIDLRSLNEIVHYLLQRENLQRRDNPEEPAVSALISFGDEKCMHCGKPEFVDEMHKENNLPLHVAAREEAKREYVDKFTEILRHMASKGHLYIKWTFKSRVELDPVTGIWRCKTLKCTGCKCAKSNKRCLTYCTCSRSFKNV